MLETLRAHVHPEDLANVERAVMDTIEHDVPFDLDFRMVCTDGREIIVHQEADLERTSAGKPKRLSGTMQDVTVRRQIERERDVSVDKLAQKQRWLQTVFDCSPTGILFCKANDSLHFTMNPAGEKLIGSTLATNEDLETLWEQIQRPDGTRISLKETAIGRTLCGDQVSDLELKLRRTDGKTVHLLVNAGPVRDARDNIQGVVATFADITALKELERLRDEWMGIVTHELRQPLTAIVLGSNQLATWAKDSSVKTKVDRVNGHARRLLRRVADLADLSRIEVQRLDIVCAPTDLQTLVARVIEELPDDDARERIGLTVDEQLPTVHVDPQRMEQVLENLLSNAVKYGAPGTPIELSVVHRAAEVIVQVTNQGAGIPEELAPRLFERYQRGQGDSRRTKGTGLGLYICRVIVKAHGGRIGAESTPNKTTTFWFSLPVGEGERD
jgi:PAS domain S-box-containing protein